MHIVIAGAGLGGLTAAVRFAQVGHKVTVFESYRTFQPQGGAIGIRPAAVGIFTSWGLLSDLQSWSSVTPTVTIRDLISGKIAVRNVLVDASKHQECGTTRQAFIRYLYHKALKFGADVKFSSPIISISENDDSVTVLLQSSEQVSCDLFLAADGIHSRLRSFILSKSQHNSGCVSPLISNSTLYGILLDDSELERHPDARKHLEDHNMNIWTSPQGSCVSRWNSRLQIWAGSFIITTPGSAPEATSSDQEPKALWQSSGDLDLVRRHFSNACPQLKAALDIASHCDTWTLVEMPNLPTWRSRKGKMVLLGDSAHGMHPNAAQGYSTIVEDIGVLDLLIERLAAQVGVAELTRIWEELRKPRVERIKAFARWNTDLFINMSTMLAPWQLSGAVSKSGPERQSSSSEEGEVPTSTSAAGDKSEKSTPAKSREPSVNYKSLEKVEADSDARFDSSKFVKWVLGCDVIAEAEEYINHNCRSGASTGVQVGVEAEVEAATRPANTSKDNKAKL